MNIVNSNRYDVAIVGAGPAGITNACLLGALNNKLKIIVFDKRPETTRNHSLHIAKDSIDAIIQLLSESIKTPTECVNIDATKKLMAQFRSWRNASIPTAVIEETLANFAKSTLNIEVHREKSFNIKAETTNKGEKEQKGMSFDDFLKTKTGGAPIIIGADGSKSEIRKVIGAKRTDEVTLSYLLELKYTAPQDFVARSKLSSSVQASKAEGFDFETVSKKKKQNPGKPRTVTLQKFIDLTTYQSLLEKEDEKTLGTPEHPWSIVRLRERGKNNPHVQKIVDYLDNYLNSHDSPSAETYSNDRIASFPITLYRSSHAVSLYRDRIVALIGDANSGLVLKRGVNKAMKEAVLCTQATLDFFKRKAIEMERPKEIEVKERDEQESVEAVIKNFKISKFPIEFIQYQIASRKLYKSEKKWAQAKSFILNTGEFLLKCVLFPFKVILFPFTFTYRKIKSMSS